MLSSNFLYGTSSVGVGIANGTVGTVKHVLLGSNKSVEYIVLHI